MEPIIIPLSVTNVYLLPCEGGYLQIDTGYNKDYPRYRQGLARQNIAPESIKFLLLTHHHDDHAGFLNELTQQSDVTIIAHQEATDLLRAGTNDAKHGGGLINGFVKMFFKLNSLLDPSWTGSFPPFALREKDILLAGDDDHVLRQCSIDGKVLYTPGHTIDHLAAVLDSGETFCGDAAANFLNFAGTHYATVFMTDMDEAYRSWQKILDVRAKVIYPGHGRSFTADKLRQNMGKIKTQQLIKLA